MVHWIRIVIGMVMLRQSCILYNRFFAARPASLESEAAPADYSEDDIANVVVESEAMSASNNPYRSPSNSNQTYPIDAVLPGGVPVPNYRKAFLIIICSTIANLLFGVVMGLGFIMVKINPQSSVALIVALSVVISISSLAVAVKCLLPTSWKKAVSIIGVFAAILVVLGALLGVLALLILGWSSSVGST